MKVTESENKRKDIHRHKSVACLRLFNLLSAPHHIERLHRFSTMNLGTFTDTGRANEKNLSTARIWWTVVRWKYLAHFWISMTIRSQLSVAIASWISFFFQMNNTIPSLSFFFCSGALLSQNPSATGIFHLIWIPGPLEANIPTALSHEFLPSTLLSKCFPRRRRGTKLAFFAADISTQALPHTHSLTYIDLTFWPDFTRRNLSRAFGWLLAERT